MINNFDLIKSFLKFDDPDLFYFVQLIRRRKENQKMETHSKLIESYYIYSLDQFEKCEQEMIDLCNATQARAYIRLNRRGDKKIAMQMLKRLADMIVSEQYNIRRLYDSIAGEFHVEPNKTWLIDVDNPPLKYADDLIDSMVCAISIIPIQDIVSTEHVLLTVPTKNGCHLIVKPFDLREFKSKYPNIDIHKDNPTILYCP